MIDDTRVLAAGSSDGHDMKLIEDAEGSLSIAVDGSPVLDYRWPSDQLEHCMKIFLGMLRHRGN